MRIRWIVLDGTPPPLGRFIPGADPFGCGSELPQRFHILTRQSGPLSVQPAFELRRIVHMETVEQRTAIDAYRIGRSARAQGFHERGSVGTDD